MEIAFLGTRTGLSRTNLFVPADHLSNKSVSQHHISSPFTHRLLLDVGGANPRCVCVCLHRDFLTAEDKEGVFNADHFPLWYKRAAEQVPGTFIYSIPFSTGENKTNILEQKDV